MNRNPDFAMFESMKENPDLIFSDAGVQLIPVEEDIESYLGSDILEIIHKTDPRICNKAISWHHAPPVLLMVILLAITHLL